MSEDHLPVANGVRSFDILLVVGYFRSATSFLSVIRHLSQDFCIGVLFTDIDRTLTAKTGHAHVLFTQLCVRFGATLVDINEFVRARVMMVQQFPYPDDIATQIQTNVAAERRVGFMALATVGIEKHDRYVEQFGIRRVFVPSRRFMKFLLARRGAESRYAGIEVEEVGLPFRRYPVFPEFTTDWLIAAPTLFSFHTEAGKHSFLRTVLALLEQVPSSDVVAYKPHNGNANDYFAPRFHYAAATFIRWLPGSEHILEAAIKHAPRPIKRHLERILTGVLHLRVLRRAKPMSELTPYADISLEAFLPGVKKGVIGGLSNTIWGTQYFGLPFYNCVDPALRGVASELLDKSSANFLDLNLDFFGVPYCQGSITPIDRAGRSCSSSEPEFDFIGELRCELAR